jgi:hypothetical protein
VLKTLKLAATKNLNMNQADPGTQRLINNAYGHWLKLFDILLENDSAKEAALAVTGSSE